MFKEVSPTKKTSYVGIRVTGDSIRITKELMLALGGSGVGIKHDTDLLEIALYRNGKHKMNKDGRVWISKKKLQLPDGRYEYIRKEGDMFICKQK